MEERPEPDAEDPNPFAELLSSVETGLKHTGAAPPPPRPDGLDTFSVLAYAVMAHGYVLEARAELDTHNARAAADPDYLKVFGSNRETITREVERFQGHRDELCADVAAAIGSTAAEVLAGVEAKVAAHPDLPGRIGNAVAEQAMSRRDTSSQPPRVPPRRKESRGRGR